MKQLFIVFTVLLSLTIAAQTTHSVSVAINQGAECPVPLDIEEPVSFDVFPNPVNGILSIQTEFEKAEISIYSLSGDLVKSFYLKAKQRDLDLNDLSSGIYILTVHADGNLLSQKIKIQ